MFNIYPIPPTSQEDECVPAEEASIPTSAAWLGELAIFDGIAATLKEWTSKASQSQRTPGNPYVVGFVRDGEGLMKPIYGPKTFTTERGFVEGQFIFGADPSREVFLQEPKSLKVDGQRLTKGKYWDVLPEDLKKIFLGGNILITSGEDLYPISSERDGLGVNIMPTMEEIDEAIVQQQGTKTVILYTGAYRMGRKKGGAEGRTGVLVRIVDGNIKPLTVEADGEQYAIELKGCGTSGGGFGASHSRTGREIVTGGCEAVQAVDELIQLDRNNTPGGTKAVAAITFYNPETKIFGQKSLQPYHQGYVVRLIPSTLRASYSGIDAYPPQLYSKEYANAVLAMFTAGLVNGIRAEVPSILDRSAHSENIVLWGNGQFETTDFSDQVPFNDPNYPYQAESGGFMTVKNMLTHYVNMMEETPGFVVAGGYKAFVAHLNQGLEMIGVGRLQYDAEITRSVIVNHIWQNGLAKRVFETRSAHGYYPEGVEKAAAVAFEELCKKVDADDEASFCAAVDAYTRSIAEFMDKLYPVEGPHKQVNHLRNDSYDAAVFHISLPTLHIAVQKYGEIFNNDINAGLSIYEALHAIIEPVRRYLEDELDIGKTALEWGKDEKIAEHVMEVEQKIAKFNAMLESPAEFWRFMTEKRELRDMLASKAYSNQGVVTPPTLVTV
ncbi:MAG: hypothetical protein WAW63_00640 [Candidatus Saccharimonadales bacterium]|nr:hypothetical protein [Candidatus Saccharibacteria bacterium]